MEWSLRWCLVLIVVLNEVGCVKSEVTFCVDWSVEWSLRLCLVLIEVWSEVRSQVLCWLKCGNCLGLIKVWSEVWGQDLCWLKCGVKSEAKFCADWRVKWSLRWSHVLIEEWSEVWLNGAMPVVEIRSTPPVVLFRRSEYKVFMIMDYRYRLLVWEELLSVQWRVSSAVHCRLSQHQDLLCSPSLLVPPPPAAAEHPLAEVRLHSVASSTRAT